MTVADQTDIKGLSPLLGTIPFVLTKRQSINPLIVLQLESLPKKSSFDILALFVTNFTLVNAGYIEQIRPGETGCLPTGFEMGI